MDIANLKHHIDTFRKQNGGRFPTTLSGDIENTRETWASVSRQLLLTKKCSLSRYLNLEYSGERVATNIIVRGPK